jgi:hypothetical protein
VGVLAIFGIVQCSGVSLERENPLETTVQNTQGVFDSISHILSSLKPHLLPDLPPFPPSRWLVPPTALLSSLLSRLTGFPSASPSLCSPRPPPESLLLPSTSSSSTTPAQRRMAFSMARHSKSSFTIVLRSRARPVSSVTTSRSPVTVCFLRYYTSVWQIVKGIRRRH